MKHFAPLLLALVLSTNLYAQTSSDLFRSAKSDYAVGKYDEAIILLNQAIALGKQGEHYKLRGDCFQKKGEFASALADYDFAERRGCTALDFHLNRGICRISMGMYEQAERDLYRHLEAFPEEAKAHYYLGASAYMQFENKISTRHLEDALLIDDDYMDAHYLMGANYAETGKTALAEQSFQICRELKPDFARIDLNLAILAIENLDPDGALEILSNLVPEDDAMKAEIHFHLGEAYFAMHDKMQACEQWNAAADLGDTFAKRNHQNICVKGNDRHKKKKTTFAEF